MLLQIVDVDILTVPLLIPIRPVIIAVITTKIAGARLETLTLVLVVKYVSKGAIVAMLVPVHATREVSTSSTLS